MINTWLKFLQRRKDNSLYNLEIYSVWLEKNALIVKSTAQDWKSMSEKSNPSLFFWDIRHKTENPHGTFEL